MSQCDIKPRYEVVQKTTSKLHPYMQNQTNWYIFDNLNVEFSMGCYATRELAEARCFKKNGIRGYNPHIIDVVI